MFAYNLGSLLLLWSVRYLWLFAQLFLPPSPLWFITFCFSSVQCNNVERVYLYNHNRLLWRLSLSHKYRSGSFGWRMSYKRGHGDEPCCFSACSHPRTSRTICIHLHAQFTHLQISILHVAMRKHKLSCSGTSEQRFLPTKQGSDNRGERRGLTPAGKWQSCEPKEKGEINWGKVEDSGDAPKLLFPHSSASLHPLPIDTVKILSCRTLQGLQSPEWPRGTNQPCTHPPCWYLSELL